MNAKRAIVALILAFGSGPCIAQAPTLLKVEIAGDLPESPTGVYLSLNHLQAVLADPELQQATAAVRLCDAGGRVVAELGALKKGKVKWAGKAVDGQRLLVRLGAGDFQTIAARLQLKTVHSGFQLLIADPAGGVLKRLELTFQEFPDLAITFAHPMSVQPGQALQSGLVLKVENRGGASVRDVDVLVVLSHDAEVKLAEAAAEDGFVEDAPLPGGRLAIPALGAGASVEVPFSEPLRIPLEAEPGKYYLAALVDPGNRIEEGDEANNVEASFIILAVPTARSFEADLAGTEIVFDPATYSFRMEGQGTILSDGQEWKRCRMKPYLYHFKFVGWPDAHWEVDSLTLSLLEMADGSYCKSGGKGRELPVEVRSRGGSMTAPPSVIRLRLSKLQLRFDVVENRFNILLYDRSIAHPALWKLARPAAHIFQFRHLLWGDFFWEVDTFRRRISRVQGGEFGRPGGTRTPLPIPLQVEQGDGE